LRKERILYYKFPIAIVAVCLTACTSLPRYENPLTGGVKPKDVVQAIECELIDALPIWKKALKKEAVKGKMVAVAELTLQVDEQATLTPSFTHTEIVSKTFSRIFNWGVKLDTTANRTYNEAVVYVLDPNRNVPYPKSCNDSNAARHSISGNLGLAELLERGLTSQTPLGRFAGPTSIEVAKAKTAFGQTVNFVVTMNVNGLGPTWSLTYFKGPGAMLFAQRIDTHKLIISFADVDPDKKAAAPRTELYLKEICDKLTGKDCEKALLPPPATTFFLIKPRLSTPDYGNQNLQDAIDAARDNNAILRLQGLGNGLVPLP
jgi:hypothetical protein